MQPRSRHLAPPRRDQCLTPAEVATRLRVSRATVYKLCTSGALPHFRVVNSIRVWPSDLEAFMRGRAK